MPKALRNLVLREQPFTPPMIAVYNKLVKQALTSSSTFLHYLEQPFLLDFAHSIKNITCVYNGDVRSVVLSNPTLTHSQSGLVIPYKGLYKNLTCHRLYDKLKLELRQRSCSV